MPAQRKCSVASCSRVLRYTNLCALHYTRRRLGVPLDKPIRPASTGEGRRISKIPCMLQGCFSPQRSLKMCSFHYTRYHSGIPLKAAKYEKIHDGRPRKLHHGYVIITVNGRDREEHRYVMEEYLGRELDSSELVHHKNSLRTDNQIENLEIHTRSSHRAIHNKGNKYGVKDHIICLAPECSRSAVSRGYCGMHYIRIKRLLAK